MLLAPTNTTRHLIKYRKDTENRYFACIGSVGCNRITTIADTKDSDDEEYLEFVQQAAAFIFDDDIDE
jgi:hypothetical protein